MNLSQSCLVLAALCQLSSAFAPLAFGSLRTTFSPPSTVLYISSWGTKGPPSRWADATSTENPATNIQSYLKAPDAVEARVNIDGTALVSGLVDNKERTDQFIFDLLNHEESAFEFKKIVAFVTDAKFAKKRLLSRSARYTGLLDKLAFIEGAGLPAAADLEGVKTWVAVLQGPDMLAHVKQIATTAKEAASVENVAILLTGANELDAASCKDALAALQANDALTFTLVAVGKMEEHSEGNVPYQYVEFGSEEGTLPATAIFSREESLRMVTELLQLEAGANKAFAFAEVYNVNQTEACLIKGLREAGYARMQEIDHMVRQGPENYKQAVEDFKTKNPDAAKGYTTTDAWWEKEEFQNSRKRTADRQVAKEKEIKDERTLEIEAVAKEWGKREFFRQSMAGQVDADMTEEDYIKSIWERAMFEGDLKYRTMKGEVMDEETELADFKSQQVRKEETMLKRAKKELKEILQEDDVDDDDLVSKINEEDDDDDDDE